jgi:hypothetical protein
MPQELRSLPVDAVRVVLFTIVGPGSPVRVSLISAACLLTWGCSDETQDLAWAIEFADDGLRTRAVAVEAFILEGGCGATDSAEAIWSEEITPSATMGAAPPALSPGTWGFAARARDDACSWYALGCEEVELGGDQPTTVTTIMDAIPAEAICPASACMAGQCDFTRVDAGPIDMDGGAVDGGPTDDAGPVDDAGPGEDAGPVDAFVPDAGVDAGPPDAGPPDAGPAPCDTTYGSAASYMRCAEDTTTCTFYVDLMGSTCAAVCSAVGGMCIRTHAEGDPVLCNFNPGASRACDVTHNDEICICTRP